MCLESLIFANKATHTSTTALTQPAIKNQSKPNSRKLYNVHVKYCTQIFLTWVYFLMFFFVYFLQIGWIKS